MEKVETVVNGQRLIAYVTRPEIQAAEKRVAKMSAEELQRVVDDFNALYYNGLTPVIKETLGHRAPMHATMTWRGVRVEKFPTDLWICQEIICSTRPDVIVECGVRNGGATLFYSDLLTAEGLTNSRVIGVDIDTSWVHPKVADRDNITIMTGSSIDPLIAEAVAAECGYKRVMVILDSEHTYDHVREELRLYAPLLTLGCSLIVEDTLCIGVMRATREFLPAHSDEFAINLWDQRLMLTQSKDGFLMRTAEAKAD